MSLCILAADDESAALNRLLRAIGEAEPDAEIRGFTDPDEALDSIGREGFDPDVAFLDIEMCGMTGIEFAKRLKELLPETGVIFVTAYSQYALEAFSVHARGYLLKPATPQAVRAELEELKHLMPRPETGIYVHTFGNFDVFVNGQPLCFHRTKAKELLAYLVDRKGDTVTRKELAAVLWEEGDYSRSRQFQLQTLITEMFKTLREAGAEQIVRKKIGSFSVAPSQFECDYYRFEKGDAKAINEYHGEYMVNYSWAEFTIGNLDAEKRRRR